MDVDGEVFTVKISPLGSGSEALATAAADKGETRDAPVGRRELPDGAVVCGVPGLILAVPVKVGDSVAEGDEVAMIETMKMRRSIVSPRPGVVREVHVQEGQMVDPEDVLIVVAQQ